MMEVLCVHSLNYTATLCLVEVSIPPRPMKAASHKTSVGINQTIQETSGGGSKTPAVCPDANANPSREVIGSCDVLKAL